MVADASGSFNVSHILEVSDTLRVHPDSLVIGARRYQGQGPTARPPERYAVPLRFRVCQRRQIAGPPLRAARFFPQTDPELLDCPGEGAEYDVSVLLGCLQNHVPVLEVPLETARPDRQTDGRSLRQIHPRIFRPLSIHGVAAAELSGRLFSVPAVLQSIVR